MHLSYALATACCVLIAASFTSCLGVAGNESGRLAARGTGTLPEAPLERVAFDLEVSESCGEGTMLTPALIPRTPYLQQVGPSGATVVWTAAEDAAMWVEVTLPDGSEVARVPSTLDGSASTRQHLSVLEGLEPASLYCYRIAQADGPLSDWAGFRTASQPGDEEAVTFVALGDMGSGHPDQYAVLEQLRMVPFDLMVTVGDNAYQDGKLSEYERNFFDVYAPVLRSAPVYPAPGNHDYRTDAAGPYLEVFVLPDNGGPDGTERWYSFDRGDVHFVTLDTERVGAAQVAWLEADLAASDRPWTVVTMHDPPYSSGAHGSMMDVRGAFVPLFERYGVDLVLTGHDHHYERTLPLDGPVYVVTGGGGRGTRSVGRSSFTAYSEDVLHFVWVRVEGDTLDLRAMDATGREFDSTIIRR